MGRCRDGSTLTIEALDVVGQTHKTMRGRISCWSGRCKTAYPQAQSGVPGLHRHFDCLGDGVDLGVHGNAPSWSLCKGSF